MKHKAKPNFSFIILTLIAVAVLILAAVAVKLQLDKKASSKVTIEKVAKQIEEFKPVEVPDEDSFVDISQLSDEEEEEVEVEEVEVKNDKNKTNNQNGAPVVKAVKSNGMPYFVRINVSCNTVTVYSQDSDGNYTIPVKAMVCSTGTATPRSGTYKISSKWRWAALFGNVYGQYATRIKGNILFHSVPYTKNYDPSSLEWWEYDKLGTACSMGCVRLTVADAIWIYNSLGSGTMVEFYQDSSSPGPLGKPGSRRISSNEACRGWDPTDPDGNNPWRNQPTPTPSPTVQPTVVPTTTTTPSVEPTVTPSIEPTPSTEPEPSVEPSPSPSVEPSTEPTPSGADVSEEDEP